MRPFIRFRCAGCGARIKAPLELLGHVRPCPGCRHGLVIRPESPEDAEPVLLLDDESSETRFRRRW
jgi:DNA-directed RNA polymerase subunit RPC12/RpoP